tara:strand:+ start:1297 stop:2238 length:942 start_codon:yes stop_codon:yes gene_type:complete
MSLNEIRETLQGTVTISDEGYGILNKRINLKEGYRHTIEAIDWFNDMGVMWTLNAPEGEGVGPTGYQFYLSPYPIQVTDEDWGSRNDLLFNSGPMAGDDTVLFKALGYYIGGAYDFSTSAPHETEFPNQSIAGIPSFNWYSDHIYLSCIVFNLSSPPNNEVPIKMSIYIKTKDTKVSGLEHCMGVYKEMVEAQCRLLTETAVNVNPLNNAGYNWPTWTYGGTRPELMLDGPSTLIYYGHSGYGVAEVMKSEAQFRQDYMDSSEMVAFDAAFGDFGNSIPQWVNIFDVSGIFTGPLRPAYPPNKYHDNGNTQML